MKSSIPFFLFFLTALSCSSQPGRQQPEKYLNGNWDKILITDAHGGWISFRNDYQILKANNYLTTTDRPDSIIKQVNKEEIEELLKLLINPVNFNSDPLKRFGKDSVWLADNAEKLWNSTKNELLTRKYRHINYDSIAVETIRNYPLVKSSIRGICGGGGFDNYLYINVSFISGTDTLNFSSSGQKSYMLPWESGNETFFNYRISEIVAGILPEAKESNKEQLSGEDFLNSLMYTVYNDHIENVLESLRLNIKYQRLFKKLGKEFKILTADELMMASIEWGDLGASCLELELQDTVMGRNVIFSAIFGRRFYFHHPINPLIRKKDKILRQLENNAVVNYTLNNKNCAGEIHFVNSKSLSRIAKKYFKEDLKENGQSSDQFRHKFKNAIFYELHEQRGNASHFSRWIFFGDGTTVLWRKSGGPILNIPENVIPEWGDICKIIDPSLLNRISNNQ